MEFSGDNSLETKIEFLQWQIKHLYFMIGERLVEESKGHIPSSVCCEEIREILRDIDLMREKE